MESGIAVSVEEMIDYAGQHMFFASTVVPLRDADGQVTGVQVVARDVTRRRRAEIALRAREERSRHDSLHDPLTRLPNRQAFWEHLDAALVAVRQGRPAFAVLCLDLDRFKNINDSLGHSIGDRLLIAFAKLLQECIGADDTLARLSGDEFGILLPNVQDASEDVHVDEPLDEGLQRRDHRQHQQVGPREAPDRDAGRHQQRPHHREAARAVEGEERARRLPQGRVRLPADP